MILLNELFVGLLIVVPFLIFFLSHDLFDEDDFT